VPPRSWSCPTPAAELGVTPLARIVSTGVSGLSSEIMGLGPVEINGGAIAVGHPFGMTGARLQNTMLNSLDWHDKTTGLITMCVGGGQGMAMILERI